MKHPMSDAGPRTDQTPVGFVQTRERAGPPVESGLAAAGASDATAGGTGRRGRVRSLLPRIPPPLIFVAAFLLGVGLQRLVPLPPIGPGAEDAVRAAGALLLVVGILLGPANALMFLLRGTTLNPVRSPSRLFTGGVYRISRNPMYIGVALIYAGVALLHLQGWALVLIVVPLWVVDRVYIPSEEQRLTQAFGAAYVAYCRRVRRWLGVRRISGPG